MKKDKRVEYEEIDKDVRLAQGGDVEARNRLLVRYIPLARKTVTRLGFEFGTEDYEDALQAGLAAMLTGIERYRHIPPYGNLTGWLGSVAHFHVMKHRTATRLCGFSDRSGRHSLLPSRVSEESLCQLEAKAMDLEDPLAALSNKIMASLSEKSAETWAAMVATDLNMSHAAKLIGISRQAVGFRVERMTEEIRSIKGLANLVEEWRSHAPEG